MNTIYFSANSFYNVNDLSFSAVEYSKFKHGSKRVSRIFGKELGRKFVNDLTMKRNFFPDIKNIVVSSSPYRFVPTASTILTDYFITEFNKVWAVDNEPAQLMKINRGHSYVVDYGNMSYQERINLISSDDFYIDKEYIKDKTLVLIDDIRITGSHEETMVDLLKKANFQGTVFLIYYADLVGDAPSTIENELNHAFVKDLLDIDYIIKNDEFEFNTRVTKYILKSDPIEFESFIKYQSNVFKETLMTNAQGNAYHKEPTFIKNYQTLLKYI